MQVGGKHGEGTGKPGKKRETPGRSGISMNEVGYSVTEQEILGRRRKTRDGVENPARSGKKCGPQQRIPGRSGTFRDILG